MVYTHDGIVLDLEKKKKNHICKKMDRTCFIGLSKIIQIQKTKYCISLYNKSETIWEEKGDQQEGV